MRVAVFYEGRHFHVELLKHSFAFQSEMRFIRTKHHHEKIISDIFHN